jgi:zinc/manganese transport system ATP-binding protein
MNTSGEPASAKAPAPNDEAPALEVDDVWARLGGHEILRGVSFSVAAGSLTGLIGENGAGKTTLLRAILGLLPISSGEVKVAHGHLGRRSIGYVPQKVVLDPDLPVRARDLVELGADGRRLGIPMRSSAKRAFVDQLLQAVDASHLADARVGALSGGEQQRVLIAHALASQPQLLLLDEPLASLDPRSTQETASLLGRIAHERKVGVLLSTHDINPLLPVMDRVVYLAAGRAVSGRTEEVVRSDVLSALYRHHVDVFHAHGRVLVSVGEEENEQGCELGADDCADPESTGGENAVAGPPRAATVAGPGQP